MARGRWLTPNTPVEHQTLTRRIDIPSDPDWIALFTGALLELTKPWNFEQYGELTPEETAAYCTTLFEQFNIDQDDPPYAQDADELDGQPTQPWYDTLADWIITGFLAVTFTPQAGIVYATTIPKMRVALRTGNIGAAFKVLLNNLEIWTGDSYGPIPDILSSDLDLQQFALDNDLGDPPWDLKIVHDGDPGEKLEVIRNPLPTTIESVTRMIGEVMYGAWATTPAHCLKCDGAVYLKADYPDLYAVLDGAYQDDATHFHTPDLRGRAMIGEGQGSGLTNRVVGASGGVETHALSEAELAAHAHKVHFPSGSGAIEGVSQASYVAGSATLDKNATTSIGSGTAHANMQPFHVLYAVIVAE